MTPTHEEWRRVRSQALLLADLVDLLAITLGAGSRAVAAMLNAAQLLRRAFDTTESAAHAYVDSVEVINALNRDIRAMRDEGRNPTQMEWEALRQRIEAASQRIAGDDDPDGLSRA